MQEKTQKLIEQLLPKWDDAMSLQNRDAGKRESAYSTSFTTVNGTFPWKNSTLVMLIEETEDGSYAGRYDGSATVVGLSKDGKLKWEYQSHCSCDDFEDSSDGTELNHEHILEKKTYELTKLPVDWEEKIQDSIEKLLVATP